MKKNGTEKIFRLLLIRYCCLVLVIVIFIPFSILFAQEEPSYSFITFNKSYDNLLKSAGTDGYQVKEENIGSVYGTYWVSMEKSLQFYSEDIALFFNENRELVFFSVRFELNENHSRTIIDKLSRSLGEKLTEKYGDNENASYPYYRMYENNYEIFLHPQGTASDTVLLSFKQLDRYSAYQEYYREEVERLENEEIAKTVGNL